MITLSLILLIVGLICFGAGAIGVGIGRANLVAAGLFCWLLAALLTGGTVRIG